MIDSAVVCVPVATLFTSPDAVRPVDAPALGPAPDPAVWVAGMSGDEWMGEGVLTQLLLGERVRVREVTGGWARLVATDQPAARLDREGYPGWLPVEQLTEADLEPGLVVDADATTLYDRPGGQPVRSGLLLGTRVTATAAATGGWQPVRAAGDAGWLPAADLAPLDGRPDPVSALRVAQRLAGVPYVWGGLSPYGIDCSGLVRLAWWRLGVTLPRDASDQAAALPSVPLGEERPGDLYVFAREGAPIHHIGFVTRPPEGGQRWLLHASSAARRVLGEPMPPSAEATLVGAHRV
jgi:cell wall-associated NlpC family hydrolase